MQLHLCIKGFELIWCFRFRKEAEERQHLNDRCLGAGQVASKGPRLRSATKLEDKLHFSLCFTWYLHLDGPAHQRTNALYTLSAPALHFAVLTPRS